MESERQRLGDFEIVREIGRGGMGVVYEAVQLSLNRRRVALKVLPWGITSTGKDVARFRREAEAAAKLHHSNIVPIYAQGEHHGTYYYAMEYIQGRSLDRFITDAGGLDFSSATPGQLARTLTADTGAAFHLEETVPAKKAEGEAAEAPPGRITDLDRRYFRTVARMVAEALEYAHGEGVIHRDIKPHNLMLTSDGRPMVTDFGLARFLDQPGVTVSGEIMGTPVYMSPEQVAAQRVTVDHRTDIYSLGVTLYEMLTLRVPFEGDTREAVLRQILMKDPPALRRLNPRIPRDLETICLKAIEKDPDKRYERAQDFARDLRHFLEGLPIVARPIGPVGRLYRRALRRKALTAAVAGALIALIVGTYFGVQAYRASHREAVAHRQSEAERQAKEAETAAKLGEQRGRLLAEAASLTKEHNFAGALPKLKEAASIKHDHATLLRLQMLAGVYSDRPLHTLTGHTDWVRTVAFSPDGKTLASGSEDKTIRLWDVASGKELRTLTGHTEAVYSVAFSPDGKTLASGSGDKSIKLWDVASGKELRALAGHTDGVFSVAFSPDGKTLASGSDDKTVKLWDVASGAEVRTLAGQIGFVVSVAFSPDGKTLASASADKTIKLWDIASGGELRTLAGHTAEVWSVAFSPDGKTLASGSRDHTIKLWDVASGKELCTLAGHTEEVLSVALSPDGKTLASGSEDDTIKLSDIASGKELRTLAGHTELVWSVAFSPDGTTLASGGFADKNVTLWDVATGKEVRTLTGHDDWVWSVAFSPDGKTLASGSADKTIKLWDVATGKELRTLTGHTDEVCSVAFSPDGKTLASGSPDKTIKLWDVVTGREVQSLSGHADAVLCVAFSPDGRTLASGGAEPTSSGQFPSTISLWDVASGRELRTLAGHTDVVTSVAFSPDGKTLASGSQEGTVKLWDVATGTEVQSPLILGLHQGPGTPRVAFSPDGGKLAYSSGKDIFIYDFHAYDEQVAQWLREAGVAVPASAEGQAPPSSR